MGIRKTRCGESRGCTRTCKVLPAEMRGPGVDTCLPLEDVVSNRRQVVHLGDSPGCDLLREVLELGLQPLCALHRDAHITPLYSMLSSGQQAASCWQLCHRPCQDSTQRRVHKGAASTCMLCHAGSSSLGAAPFASAAGCPRDLPRTHGSMTSAWHCFRVILHAKATTD